MELTCDPAYRPWSTRYQVVLTVTSSIEFIPSTRFVASPLFRFVNGSLVSSPSTMKPLDVPGKPLTWKLPNPLGPPTKSLPEPAVFISAPAATCAGDRLSPPGFGRLSIAATLKGVVVLGLRVFSSGGAADTLTDAVRPAMGSLSVTVSARPRCPG